MSWYRGLYRGPGFVLVHTHVNGARDRYRGVWAKHEWWTQEELDEAKREAKRVDAKLNWTGTKEGV